MSTSAARSRSGRTAPKRPALPRRNGNTATAYRASTGRTVCPPAPGTGAATNGRPASRRSARAVSMAARSPAAAAARVSPSHGLSSRSSTVTNQRCALSSRTTQW